MVHPTQSLPLVLVLLVAHVVYAHDHGSDDDMDNMDGMGVTNLAAGQMLPYLHSTPGDILWFEGWVPKKAGPMVGACLGLFLLAIFERWLAACRGVAERSWAYRYVLPSSNNHRYLYASLIFSSDALGAEKAAVATRKLPIASPTEATSDLKQHGSPFAPPLPKFKSVSRVPNGRKTPPFILSHDLSRGVVHAAQTALGFVMMLAVMCVSSPLRLSRSI